MNKALVEKLAVQSLVWVDTGLADGREQIFSTQKFAELIVKECLDIVNRVEYSYHEADPLWETSQLIKEHFGVEGMSMEDKKTLIKELLGVKE